MKGDIAQYEALMENSFSAVFLAKPTGEVVKVNAAAEKMFGYREAELIKIRLEEIFDYSAVLFHQAETKFERRGERGIPHGIRKNGEKFPVEFISKVFTDIDREEHIYISINDISERIKLQEMSLMVNHTFESILLLNQHLGIVNFNIQFRLLFESYLGFAPETEKYILDYIPCENRDGAAEILFEALAGKVGILDINIPDTTGGMRFFNFKFSPSLGGNMEPSGVVITIRDISNEIKSQLANYDGQNLKERPDTFYEKQGIIRDISSQKQKDQELRLMSAVVNSTNDAVMIMEAEPLDEPGPKIVYINKSFTKMSGYTEEEVLGKNPRFLQGPNSDRMEFARLKKAMENKASCEITSINYKKDGEPFWVNFSISPVENSQGLITHFIAIERDITLMKNEDLQKTLLNDLSRIFKSGMKLSDTLSEIIKLIYSFGGYCLAEAWLTDEGNKKIKLVSSYSETTNNHSGYSPGDKTDSLAKGEGHAGLAWQTKEIQYWRGPLCYKTDIGYGNGLGFAIPMLNNDQVIGVLVFEHEDKEYEKPNTVGIYKKLGSYLGPEIKRKQLEQELTQLFNFAPGIISVTGMNGLIKKINPAACELLEYSEEELLETPLINFVHVEDRDRTITEYENLKLGKPVPYLENRYVTKSGKVKWLAWALTSSPGEGEIYSVAKDISEKKELEVLLQKATNLARIGSWELDLIKNKVYWSEITREIHEVQSEYVPDLETAMNFYREGRYRSQIHLNIREAIEKGKNWDGEFQIITGKGNKRWIRIIGEPEMVNGKCVRIYGSFQDIDKRKKSEENIRGSEESKKLIMNSALDAIIFIDSAGAVTFWNPQAERIFGWKENEVLGKVLSSLIIPEAYRTRHDEGMKNYLRTGEGPVLNVLLELSAIKRSGEEFPIELTVLPIHQEGEAFFCAFIRDISQRKNSESRLVELNDSLKKQAADLASSNEDLEQFAYIASHDLQEPLRMISSFLSQLEKNYANAIDEKGRKYIYYATDGAKRMRQIILDLLEFSRIGRGDGKTESVDLNEVLKELRILFRKEIRDKKATIILDPLPVAQIDKTPLRQVFHNLISNALKYSRKEIPVQIQITAVDYKTHWQFAVADNGIGIEKDYFEKIFIIFQRLHGKEEYSGTGMGLAVTKKIVESWGGEIYLESTVGKGSKFYFTIPV